MMTRCCFCGEEAEPYGEAVGLRECFCCGRFVCVDCWQEHTDICCEEQEYEEEGD
jgi:hypothetical protein